MLLIIGLGNKDEKLKTTRHNIGSEIIKKFVKKNFDASLILDKKLNSWIYRDDKVFYAIPYCFMNESGLIVKSLIKKLNLKLDDLLIIHDDTDLTLGKFKIQKNRGSAGHKGVESIIKNLSSKNFWRLRIGVRPPILKNKAVDLVLKSFSKEEQKILSEKWILIEAMIKNWIKNH
jgi:PTH1 family peptidyl-tRNA hydrolase